MKDILLTSSVLIAALLLLRRVFRDTVSRRVQYGLWALVLVRLLVPATLPAADFSVLSVSGPVRTQIETYRPAPEAPVRTPDASPRAEAPAAAERPASPAPEAAKSAAPTVREVLPLVWKTGMAVMACWVAGTNLRFWGLLRRRRRPLPVEGCRYRVFLVEEGLASPCLFGLWRPAVYLTPAALASQASLGHVLAHEETHARHLDPLWSLLRCLCLVVYWFDPLVWWAASASRADCELACDEGTLARLGEAERVPYGKTLLSLIPVKREPGRPLLAATTMTAGKKQLKERIERIAEHKRAGVLSLCVLLVLVTAACAATFTGGGEASAPAPGPSTAPVTAPKPSAAPEVIGREPVLSIPLTGLEPYAVEGQRITAEEPLPGALEPDTVSVDTMGEVLVDKTLSDGTRIVCFWDPDPENQYSKYWAIRDGDTLLRFYKEESGYDRDYDVGEYTGLFDHDGFILYAPRGGAYFAIDYWYLDDDGVPRMLADCSNRVIRADWNGDGEDDLMWFYHDSPYLYFRRDGVLYLAGVLGLVEDAWPEAQFLGYGMPEDDSGSYIEISGYVDVPSEVAADSVSPVLAPREIYFQGGYMNVYKPLEPAVTDRVYDSIEAPEEVRETAKRIAGEEFDRWLGEGIPGDVDDWRISRLERVETPEVSDSRRPLEVECYRLDYEFHAAAPGDVVMAGGVTVYEDGWFNGFSHPYTWLLFQVKDGKRELLDAGMVCDTSPESVAFKAEYAWALTKAGVLAASELESEALYLDFCYMPVRFLNGLAYRPSGEQTAALEKLASFVHNAVVPEEYASEYPNAMEALGYAVETGELTGAAKALYERLPAGDEGPAIPRYTEERAPGGTGGSGLISPLPPATPGSLTIDPLDYGITPEMLSLEEDPHWDEMGVGALCAYYLNSDGAGAEGSSDALYRVFLSTPEEVLAHLEAIGDQAAPSGSGLTAAAQLCRAIASADVFWYDCDPAFADVMEQCRKEHSGGPVSELLDTIEREHQSAMARSQMKP